MTQLLELLMIVKNSGDILKECLLHNKQFIDHWTILDTGSSDNTKDIIREVLSDIPGTLYEDDAFVDFKHARNRCLSLASRACKYLIILDDSYMLYGGDKLRNLLQQSKQPCFSIFIGNYINNYLQNNYVSNRILKSSSEYEYKYRVHEYLNVPSKEIGVIDESLAFISDVETTVHKNRSVSRYKRDIEMLLLDLKDDNTSKHVLYYLAKTYYNIEDYTNALKYFNKLLNCCHMSNADKEYVFTADMR